MSGWVGGGGGGGGKVATKFSVSSRQGFKLEGISPFTIPCLSLPDPCLSFTISIKPK